MFVGNFLKALEMAPVAHIVTGINFVPEKFDRGSINLLILFGIRSNCLRSRRSRSIRRVIKQTVVMTEAFHFCQVYTTPCCQG
jgi:hypothetical protein